MSGTAKRLIVPTVDQALERRKILSLVGDVAAIKVFGNRVLVAKYIHNTLGSIYTASQTKTESKWQGKVGLVLKVGHLAFKSDANNDFGPDAVVPGDWVVFNYGDGSDFEWVPDGSVEHVYCKLVRDTEIHGVVSNPHLIW